MNEVLGGCKEGQKVALVGCVYMKNGEMWRFLKMVKNSNVQLIDPHMIILQSISDIAVSESEVPFFIPSKPNFRQKFSNPY